MRFCTPAYSMSLFALIFESQRGGPGRSALCTCGKLCARHRVSATHDAGYASWNIRRRARSACETVRSAHVDNLKGIARDLPGARTLPAAATLPRR